jgi:hypothetical protein
MATALLQHEFVPRIPDELANGHLYVCVEHATVVHLCCCGCGSEVVTPITPRDWQLTFDGETISLSPSIGNWSFTCRSHYWIRANRVIWARRWSRSEVEAARAESAARGRPSPRTDLAHAALPTPRRGLLAQMMGRLFRAHDDSDSSGGPER